MASGRSVKAGSAYVQFFLDDGKLQRGLKTTEARMRQFGAKLRNVGAGALAGGLAGLTAIALPFAKLAEFDDAIRAVGAVTSATADELRDMEKAASELGRTTSFTAVEVASLMTELGRAGFKPDQINNMTEAVLNLSRATGTDAALSAGIMAASIRQFGLGAEDATRIANVLTVAANSTFNTVEGLGESLKFAGPVAADLGMSLEDTVAILGTLGNVGIQGSNAGTAIRRLGTLGAAEADKLQKIFGVAFKDSQGNARPLIDALGDVAEATDGLPTAERAEKFNEAFGLLGITGASAISKSAGATKDLAKQLKGVTTEAADAAAAMDAGPGGMIRRLQSAFEGLQIAIGKASEVLVSSWGEDLTSAIGVATAFVEQNQAMVVMFAKVAAAIAVGGAGLVSLGLAFQAAALATGGFSAAISLSSRVVGVLSSVSLSALYRAITVQIVPSMIAMTTKANLAKVAMIGLKAAMAGAVLYAIYKVSSAIYAANGNLREFNKQLKESDRLANKMASIQQRRQNKTLKKAEQLTGEDREQFLALELERAKKELSGKRASIAGQKKVVGGLDTGFNSLTGNKVLEGEKKTLTELQAQERSLEEFTDNLKDLLADSKQEPPTPTPSNEAQASEASSKQLDEFDKRSAALTVDDDAIKLINGTGVALGLGGFGGLGGVTGAIASSEFMPEEEPPPVPSDEVKRIANEAGAILGFGGIGGLAGLTGAIATNEAASDAVSEIASEVDEERNVGVESAANSAVNVRSSESQEAIAKALTGQATTEEQFDASLKQQTKDLLDKLERIRKQEENKPSIKATIS